VQQKKHKRKSVNKMKEHAMLPQDLHKMRVDALKQKKTNR
jgi:hypothetical protein